VTKKERKKEEEGKIIIKIVATMFVHHTCATPHAGAQTSLRECFFLFYGHPWGKFSIGVFKAYLQLL
jgi:hypothetical protein